MVYPLSFPLPPWKEEWQKGDFHLKFFALRIKVNPERLGIFCLTIPGEAVTAGKSIELKVTGYKKTGAGNSFFMLSNITNTLKRINS